MGLKCEITGSGTRCAIEILGYENPSAATSTDANWLSCRVVVAGASFSARSSAAFTTQDFGEFAEQLGLALDRMSGAALFRTDEEVLALQIDIRKTGVASVEGTMRVTRAPAVTVSFSFETDQTCLSETRHQLEALALTFPARTIGPK